MNDGIDREWQPSLAHKAGRTMFLRLCPSKPGNSVSRRLVRILKADLHMFEAGYGQSGYARGIEPDSRGDQIAIESNLGGVADLTLQIAAH